MERKDLNTLMAMAVVAAAFLAVVGIGAGYFVMDQALKNQRMQLRQARYNFGNVPGVTVIPQQQFQQFRPPSFQPFPARPATTMSDAAPDSLEGQLRSQGKTWVRTPGKITPGVYVEDILIGRMGQPTGRGRIGKVKFVDLGNAGRETAEVDFGRGYVTGVYFSELSVVSVIDKKQ